MVLESTIVCVDNSEFSRNGDFAPTRFAAQVDSVNVLCSAKIQSHPENTVGLLTTAGKSPRILISATQDLGKVFACMHDVRMEGYADIVAGIQKAQLALKHRQNTNQRQRVVLFVSSPIVASEEVLVSLGKKLKKNGVAVDVIHVGDDTSGTNSAKLDAFIQAVNSGDNSRIIHVPAGGPVLVDALMSSEIYADRDNNGAGAASAARGDAGSGAGGEGFEFGVDPSVDPELAMVLRLSMEEERARQAAASAAAADVENDGSAEAAAVSGIAGLNASAPVREHVVAEGAYDDDADLYGTSEGPAPMDTLEDADEDENAILRQAIALSQLEAGGNASGDAAVVHGDEVMDEEMDEETRRAIELSKIDFDEETKDKKKK